MCKENTIPSVVKSIMAKRRQELNDDYYVIQIPIPKGIKLIRFAKAWSLFGIWIDDCCDVTRYGKTVDIWIPPKMFEVKRIADKVGSFIVDPRDLDLGREQ